MDIKDIKQRLDKLEKNARDNMRLVKELRDLFHGSSEDIPEVDDTQFNTLDLLKGLSDAEG
jgi:hypothetical protein